MVYVQHRPAPPLNDLIELLWYCADYHAAHRREIVFPSGSTALILALAHDRMPNWSPDLSNPAPVSDDGAALIAGVHTGYMVIDTVALDSLLGVHFRPAGALAILGGTPLAHFRNAHVPLDAVWPCGEVVELRERASLAPTPRAKLRVLEAALLARFSARALPPPPPVTYAVNRLSRAPHIETVASVAGQTGLSARRLSDLFQQHVGIPPKVFCRIKRFRLAVERMNAGREIRWADLAADCGFYDQSHFLREFRAFSGINPNDYQAGRGVWNGHLIV